MTLYSHGHCIMNLFIGAVNYETGAAMVNDIKGLVTGFTMNWNRSIGPPTFQINLLPRMTLSHACWDSPWVLCMQAKYKHMQGNS